MQRVELEQLAELAEQHDIVLHVLCRPGDFLVRGDTPMAMWARAMPERDAADHDDPAFGKLHDCFETSYQRSAGQDWLFLADQLVEVIGRAMSPGINDPFTAITCLNWLKVALIEFIECDAAGTRLQPHASLRIDPIDFERLLSVVFDQTRQYVCADRDVALHAMKTLGQIGARSTRTAHRGALRQRIDELLMACDAVLPAEAGGADVARLHAQALRSLANQRSSISNTDDGTDDERPTP